MRNEEIVHTVVPTKDKNKDGYKEVFVTNGEIEKSIKSAQKRRIWRKNNFLFYAIFAIIGFTLLLLTALLATFITQIVWYNDKYDSSNESWFQHTASDRLHHMNIVHNINKAKLTWKAKYNRFASTAEKDNLQGDIWTNDVPFFNNEYMVGDTQSHLKVLKQIDVTIPERFDARERWPLCWSVHQVANQGGCGSCWAMSATSVISDRICISSNYTKQQQISAQDLVSCCTKCGGCHGSLWALSAFAFWKETGLVTGGSYGSSEGCKPYSASTSCGGPCHLFFYRKERTPKCEKKCQETYDKSYQDSLVKGRKAYWIRAERGSSFVKNIAKELNNLTADESITLIKKEIFIYGPVLVCFTIHEDFQHYESGIYQPLESSISLPLYGHCVKLIGWGKEGNYSYWHYMNTWGRDWGENGFFRVILSEVPEEVVAGLL